MCGLLCQRSQKITIHFLMVALSTLIPQKSSYKSPAPPLVSATRKFKFTSWWSFLVLGSLASLYTMHALAFICVFLSSTATSLLTKIYSTEEYSTEEKLHSYWMWWGTHKIYNFVFFKLLSQLTSHCGQPGRPLWSPRNAEQMLVTLYYERSTHFIMRGWEVNIGFCGIIFNML